MIWTYDNLLCEAIKYKTRGEFRSGNPKAYSSSNKHKLRESIFSHMPPITKFSKNHWKDFNNCHMLALTCLSKMEFRGKSQVAYNSLLSMGRLNEACSHMVVVGNKMMKFVYAYEFSDGYVYVGICGNKSKRHNNHLICGSVFDHVIKTNLNPKLVYMTPDPIPTNDASILEGVVLEEYINNGWKKLNRAPTGGVGGSARIWTPESCAIEAKKYLSRTEFSNGSRGAYVSANKYGIMDSISTHMKVTKKH